jgi:hypothetical protein
MRMRIILIWKSIEKSRLSARFPVLGLTMNRFIKSALKVSSPPSRRIDFEFILGIASEKVDCSVLFFQLWRWSEVLPFSLLSVGCPFGGRRVGFLLGYFPLNQYKYYRLFFPRCQQLF